MYKKLLATAGLMVLLSACKPDGEMGESANSSSQRSERAYSDVAVEELPSDDSEQESESEAPLEENPWKNYTFSYNHTNPKGVLEELFQGKDFEEGLMVPTVFGTVEMYRHYSGYLHAAYPHVYDLTIYEAMEPMPENPEELREGDQREGYMGAAIPKTTLTALRGDADDTPATSATHEGAKSEWLKTRDVVESAEYDLGYGTTGYWAKKDFGSETYSWDMGQWLIEYILDSPDNEFAYIEGYNTLDEAKNFVARLQEHPLPEINGTGVLIFKEDRTGRQSTNVTWYHDYGHYWLNAYGYKEPIEVVQTIAGMRLPEY